MIRATTDSPMSPPPLANIASSMTSKASGSSSAPQTLYDMFVAWQKPKSRPEFHGRAGGSLVAKLYPNLKTDRPAKPDAMDID